MTITHTLAVEVTDAGPRLIVRHPEGHSMPIADLTHSGALICMAAGLRVTGMPAAGNFLADMIDGADDPADENYHMENTE